MSDVTQIKPYDNTAGTDKSEQVRQMFDNIAPAYDFMNRAMTMGIDRWWRRVAVKRVARMAPQQVLDAATGTGDFALLLCRKIAGVHVTGIDLSQGMLDVARQKAERAGLSQRVTFTQGDCLQLPLATGSMDAVTIAFGVRNFAALEQGLSELCRVLRPGGMLCVLELSVPTNAVARWFYNLYTLHIIPAVGSLIAHDRAAYRYLPLSIAAAPQGEAMTALMEQAGFEQCTFRRLTLGTCTLYTGTKKEST